MSGDGNEYRRELLRLGLEIGPGRGTHALLGQYILETPVEKRAISVEKIGWYKQIFVFPNQTIGDTDEKVLYQSANITQHHFSQQGSLTGWKEQASRYCIGNSRLVFAVSLAFAGPLLYLLSEESGGFHFTGSAACGKTTALRVAASVFGGSEYLQRWRATINGLEGLAQMHNDTVLILDELAQVSPDEAGESAYMLSNGQGKVRAQKNGTARKTTTWRLLFLSAGEVSLADHMLAAHKTVKAGQEVRLADIPADTGEGLGIFEELHGVSEGAEFSRMLVESTGKYFGTVGFAWIEFVIRISKNPDQIKALKELQQKFVSEVVNLKVDGQVKRIASRMGLVAAAGIIATKFGLTGWPENEAWVMVKKCFQSWLDQRGGTSDQEEEQILSQVKAFLETNGESQFTPVDDIGHIRTQNRAGFRETMKDADNGEEYVLYYVFTQAYKKRMCAGRNQRTVSSLLIEREFLIPDLKTKKAYQTKRFSGMGAVKCYVINGKILNE